MEADVNLKRLNSVRDAIPKAIAGSAMATVPAEN